MVDRKSLFRSKIRVINRGSSVFQRQLRAAECLNLASLAELNWKRRKDLIRLCAKRIPFYQRKFRAIGFEPEDLKSESDFQNLPILEKDEIRVFAHEIVNPEFNIERLPTATTGGTAGTPLKTYNDPRVHHPSMSWRMLNWWGVDPSDNSAYLYRGIPTGLKKLITDIALWPTRRQYIGAADMTPQNMELFYKRLVNIRPKYLVGYVGAIDAFASFLQNNNYFLPGLNAVWTTSAPLPKIKRNLYEQVYGCPVYTQYGSCEFYWVAAECTEKCGLHIGSDIRHVDVLEGKVKVPVGEFGDLVITDLLNYAFPLLRYRVGDRGRLLDWSCDCGLPFPMMDYVKGRSSDAIHLPNQTRIPGEYWTTIFDDFTAEIRAFQVWQHADFSLEIRYETHENIDATNVITIVGSRLRDKLQGRIRLSFKECSISGNDNGKLRFVVSEVAGSRLF
jgi:phenylacetate-CoA ligase